MNERNLKKMYNIFKAFMGQDDMILSLWSKIISRRQVTMGGLIGLIRLAVSRKGKKK